MTTCEKRSCVMFKIDFGWYGLNGRETGLLNHDNLIRDPS